MLYSAVRFPYKFNLRDFEVEGHFLLEARKISFTGPWGHFLEVSHSLGRAFPAGFRRDAHSAGNLVLQLRGPHLRIWP